MADKGVSPRAEADDLADDLEYQQQRLHVLTDMRGGVGSPADDAARADARRDQAAREKPRDRSQEPR